MKQLIALSFLGASILSAQPGAEIYKTFCSACHAPDGKGANNGQFPPLVGSEWVKGDGKRMIQVVLGGLQGPITVAGKDYNLVMPPHGGSMTDEQIANVVTYVRSNFGHKESAITAAMVKEQRNVPGSPEMPNLWKAEDLLKKFPFPGQKVVAAPEKSRRINDLLSYIHHGDFKTLADLRKSKPKNVEEEKAGLISVKHADRKDKFGLVWEGWLDVPKDGHYRFHYDTDDGGAVTINGKEIITRNRLGSAGKPSVKGINLKKGRAEIKIEFYEYTGQEFVSLSWEGPGLPKQSLSESTQKQGKGTPSIPLTPPVNEAIIYRNFIAGTDPRGIGVGFFEGVNLAFSADSMSLDMIWTGKFMDAGRHWTNRGQGFEPPAGAQKVTVNRGFSFALLDSQAEQWPKKADQRLKPRFRGYKLDQKQRPTFLYEIAGAKVSDQTIPASGKAGMNRTLTLEVPSPGAPNTVLYFRALSGQPITAQSNSEFTFGQSLQALVPNPDNHPFVRKNELIIPVPLTPGTHTIELIYNWK